MTSSDKNYRTGSGRTARHIRSLEDRSTTETFYTGDNYLKIFPSSLNINGFPINLSAHCKRCNEETNHSLDDESRKRALASGRKDILYTCSICGTSQKINLA